MKNCFDCQHSKTFSLDLADRKELMEYNANPQEYIQLKTDSPLVKMRVGKCLLGYNEKMKSFRDEHGNKTRTTIEEDRSLDMDCHDYHKSTKMLISISDKADEFLKLLQTENEKKDGTGA
jgi:hypothetical protein